MRSFLLSAARRLPLLTGLCSPARTSCMPDTSILLCTRLAHARTLAVRAPLQISRLTFVDMPGAERLTMDPELLRLREGNQLNRSLLGFVGVLRR